MSAGPKFTVVLSGYRTEPYLPRALKSIAEQTFTDFEAICYVEESPDGSLALCQEQAEKDPRFKVVSAPKSGAVATTRNYAIDHAQGEYLLALDGDDWLDIRQLEGLEKKLRETGPLDVLAFAAVTVRDDETDLAGKVRLTNFRPQDAEGVFTGREALRRAGRGGQFRSYVWLSAYRTAFLRENRLYQSDGLLMEDFEWTPRVWFAAERFAYLDEVFYVYRRRGNSLTTESSSRLLFDLVKQVRSLLDFSRRTQLPEDIARIWSDQWISTLLWFMFHPVSSRKIGNRDRQKALAELFSPPGKEQFLKLAARTSPPKRLAVPLLRLAAAGIVLPANLYFRLLYYPLTGLRTGRARRKS
ncbi:MAG: glycosyltransferase [Lentisphaeria bacterium]|nr:glycosyltransferase [Lentisphaeria bacterium]